MNTDRIKQLAKKQGKTVTYICKLIDRPKYYLNDVAKAADREIPEKTCRPLQSIWKPPWRIYGEKPMIPHFIYPLSV